MNDAGLFSAAGLIRWLADFYLLATVLLLIAMAARRCIRQPLHRLTLAWVVTLELAALAVVCALPGWPRIALLDAAGAGRRRPLADGERGRGFCVAACLAPARSGHPVAAGPAESAAAGPRTGGHARRGGAGLTGAS